MTGPEIAQVLHRLMMVELELSAAYDVAVAMAPPGPIADELGLFRVEHQRHVMALHGLFSALRETPPSRPYRGPIALALAAARARRGDVAALLGALHQGEQLSASLYAKTLAHPLPATVRQTLEPGHREDLGHSIWLGRALQRAGQASHAAP